jgi:hypothetical protein
MGNNTLSTEVFGGPTDTWGVSITAENLNSYFFGASLQFETGSDLQFPVQTLAIDSIGFNIYYTGQTNLPYYSTTGGEVLFSTGEIFPDIVYGGGEGLSWTTLNFGMRRDGKGIAAKATVNNG